MTNDIDAGTAVWTLVATFHADRHDFGIDTEQIFSALIVQPRSRLRLRTTTTGDLELWRRKADDE